jgi:hypothetical protein
MASVLHKNWVMANHKYKSSEGRVRVTRPDKEVRMEDFVKRTAWELFERTGQIGFFNMYNAMRDSND